jgi:hypothetical protein
MQVRLYRHGGQIGRFAHLEVLVNGKKAGSIERNGTLTLQLPDDGASMQVAMGSCRSPTLWLGPRNGSVELECGSSAWWLFDFLDLAYFPPFNKRVFFLREIARA